MDEPFKGQGHQILMIFCIPAIKSHKERLHDWRIIPIVFFMSKFKVSWSHVLQIS